MLALQLPATAPRKITHVKNRTEFGREFPRKIEHAPGVIMRLVV